MEKQLCVTDWKELLQHTTSSLPNDQLGFTDESPRICRMTLKHYDTVGGGGGDSQFRLEIIDQKH